MKISEMQLDLAREVAEDVWFLIRVSASNSFARTTRRMRASRLVVWRDEIEVSIANDNEFLTLFVYQYGEEGGDVDDFIALASATVEVKDVVGGSVARQIHLTEDGLVANSVNHLKDAALKVKLEDTGALGDSGTSQLGMR